jgi:hypothetical protein
LQEAVLGPKKEKVAAGWRRLHNEFHNLYSLPNVIWMAESMKMRCAGHVAGAKEVRNAHKILVGKTEGKRPLGDGKIILKWILDK